MLTLLNLVRAPGFFVFLFLYLPFPSLTFPFLSAFNKCYFAFTFNFTSVQRWLTDCALAQVIPVYFARNKMSIPCANCLDRKYSRNHPYCVVWSKILWLDVNQMLPNFEHIDWKEEELICFTIAHLIVFVQLRSSLILKAVIFRLRNWMTEDLLSWSRNARERVPNLLFQMFHPVSDISMKKFERTRLPF